MSNVRIPRNAAVLSVDIVGHEALKRRVRNLEKRITAMEELAKDLARTVEGGVSDPLRSEDKEQHHGMLIPAPTRWRDLAVAGVLLLVFLVSAARGALPEVSVWNVPPV
jgi:hypothetical protein